MRVRRSYGRQTVGFASKPRSGERSYGRETVGIAAKTTFWRT